MESPGEHESGRYKMDCYKAVNPPWNMIQQHQIKEQSNANALVMNKKILAIFGERDAAIRERNIAVAETNEALAARDEALLQRDKAIAERDTAIMERDNVLAVLQCRENLMNSSMGTGTQRGGKRLHHPTYHPHDNMGDIHATDALPLSTITSEELKSHQAKKGKQDKNVSPKVSKAPRSVKKMGEDLNKQVFADVKKSRSEWDSLDMGLTLINFDETIMPPPVCTCTGVPRQCYKWGNGGWQSSCCTTTLSCHPLPQMPNKRHARVGGRKMSGSVFTKLLSRFAAEGHDLSMPLDLKNYWARHGTNRYITIK